jgi:RNA polymerase sigma factor (sigma-70 family)
MDGRIVEPKDEPQMPGAPLDGSLLGRFVDGRDQGAFASLMDRHGPYVLAVCRRLTHHPQDAEDVFQACFLQLAQKAATIRQRTSVAGWLQTVAVRMARRACARRERLRTQEAALFVSESTAAGDDLTWREVRRVVEEEVARLPADVQEPIIHCLMRGETQEQASRFLGINVRTLKRRLQRGREILQRRLTRRGIALGTLGVLLGAAEGAQAAVPAALTKGTLAAASAVANKTTLTGAVSPAVLGLTSSSALTPIGMLFVALLAATVFVGGLSLEWSRGPEIAAVVPVKVAGGQTIVRSFRGGQFDETLFRLDGPTPTKYIRREEEGLRITLPAEGGPAFPVGLLYRFPVRGDFDFVTTFECLRADQPDLRLGSGGTLYVYMKSPNRDALWCGKLNDAAQGAVFSTGHRVTLDDRRLTKSQKLIPTAPLLGMGRLRITRTGDVFETFAAEGDDGPYQSLERYELGRTDVDMLRVAAEPAEAAHVGVDIRVLSLSLTATELVGYHASK